MIRAAALLLSLAVAVPVHAGEVVFRSPSSRVLSSPPKVPTIPVPPDTPAGFELSISGKTTVPVGGTLNLRPVVSGGWAPLSYLLGGRLPLGATFDARTGRIGGRPVEPGTYSVTMLAADSVGAAAAVSIIITVS
jgi:Putative Ig domain